MKRLIVGLVVVAVMFSLLPSTAWTNPCSNGDYDCNADVDFFDYILFAQDFMRGFMDQSPIEPCRACSPFAVNDTTGVGQQLGPLDLATSSVITYDKENPSSIPDFVKIGVTMAAGSHLPAVIYFDFDVDNDTATGGRSFISSVPANNCGGQPCKTPADDGFDFYVVLALRTQGNTSSLSLCNGCSETSCNKPLLKGGYYVGYGPGIVVKVGDITIRQSYSFFDESELCTTLPWGLIVTQMWSVINDAANPIHLPFDVSYTVNNPPKYQVSVLYDSIFVDGDDLFSFGPFTVDVNDWLPDTDRVADGEFNPQPPCP